MSNTAINETYIIEGIGETLDFSACTAIFTNALKSCSGNTAIELGENLITFNGNALASIISATTYYGDGSNLTGISGFSTNDTYVTGGTYSNGVAVFTNNTGGTFSVTGFSISNATQFTGGTISGATNFTNGLSANTFSATTYLGLPITNDTFVTGGTYSDGTAEFTNNTGGTFNITGFTTPFTGGTVNGPTTFTNGLTANTFALSTTPNVNTTDTDVLIRNQSTGIIEQRSINSLNNVVNLVTVGLSGSVGVDYNSIKEAVDSITGANASNTYVVKVGPGVFYEDPITMKSYVDVIGESETNTIIQANNPNTSLIIGADQSMVSDVQIQGCTGTGVAAVIYSSPTTPQLNAIFYVENVRFGANYTHAKTVGTSGGNCIMQCSNVKYGGYPFTLGFHVTNDGSGIGRMQLRNVTSTNGGVTTTSGLVFAKADKPSCAFIVNGCLLTKASGAAAGTGFWVENGGSLRLTGVNFQRWVTGIYAPQTGLAPSIEAIALNFENCTTDVNIIHSGATGKIQGTDNYTKTFINIDAPLYEVNKDPRVITVAKKGGDFSSIKAAVDSITGSSTDNRFLISVGPGKFTENEIDLTGKPYVSIEGSNIITTEIVPSTNTQHIIKLGQNNELSFLRLSNAPSGYAAIYIYDIGDYGQAHKISFTDCDTNVWIESHTQDTKFYGEYLDYNGSYSYGTKIIAYNGYLAYANMENYYNLPSGTGTTIGNHVQGSGATLSVFVGDGIGNGGIDSANYQILDYASLNTISTTAYNWDYGIRVLNIGGPSRFDIDSYSVVDSLVYDLSIEHPNAFGTFGGGSSTHTKINNLSDSVYWAFLDTNDGEFEITRKMSVTFQDGTHTDASTLIFESSTMGLIDGGVITHVSGLTFEVSSGFGYLEKTVGFEIYMRVDWPTTQITLLPNSENYLYFNENEILSSAGSIPNNTNNIILGRVVTDSSSLRFIDNSPNIASHTSNLFSDFNRNALGPIYATGSIVSENITPYHLNISAGDYYYSENNFKPSGGTDVSFVQYYRDGSSGWITTGTTEVVNGYDDNSGTISPLPLSSFTKHTLYVVGDGVNEKYMLVLGQTYYTTLVEAEGAELPTPPNYFDDSVTTIANILIQQGVSGITQIQDIRPVIGFKAAGVSASALHANLLGLSADDHTQYLLVNGNRAMSGNLSMGGNAIVNGLTYNGVTIESHASRHKNGGADEIATATPAPSEIPKADTFGKLDGWISDASTSVKGLTTLSQAPASASLPIAVGVNDPRFLNAITAVTNTTPSLVFTNNSGGTTTLSNIRLSAVTATTISATTYQNLPIDIRVTGGTYSNGTTTYRNNTGGTFTVTGLTTPFTGGTVSGATRFTGGVTANTISATTYVNLPTDIRVTGGTYNSSVGQATFINNTGGTFFVGGFFRPSDDIYVTGGTTYHGPTTSNNKFELFRNDNNTVIINDLINISDTNRNDVLSIISEKGIIRGKTYKIGGCDNSLYYNGTDSVGKEVYTTVYLMGLESDKLSETGIGVFYTPDYSQYGIFNPEATYVTNDKVIWGGYVWENKGLGNGSSLGIFDLDTVYWTKALPFKNGEFNDKYYVVRYDDIIYDITSDRIIYRNEENTNIVSTSSQNITHWIDNVGLYNPIRVFQWGNVYNSKNLIGIGNQTIINSYNENINYRGKYQRDFYFEGLSYQNNVLVSVDSYQNNFYFKDGSYQSNVNVIGSSYQSSIYLTNLSYLSNIIISVNSYQDGIYLDNESFINNTIIDDNSRQDRIRLNNKSYFDDINLTKKSSYQEGLYFNNGSYQSNITFYEGCSQSNFNFDNNSYQSNITLLNSVKEAQQISFNFTNVSRQTSITIDSTKQQEFNFNYGYQNNITTTTGQSYITIENGIQLNNFDIAQSNVTIKGYELNWAVYPTFINPQDNLFFIHDLPSEKTSKLVGKVENRLVEVSDLYYDGTKWVIDGDIQVGNITASNYLGLPLDIRVTGGTFNSGTSTATFTNNTGGTFSVSGFSSGGGSFTGGTVSGATRFTNGLTANTISATTYQGLPISIVSTSNLISTGLDGAGNGVSGLISNSNFFGENAGYQATSASNSNFFGFNAGLFCTGAYSSNFLGNGAGIFASNAFQSNFLGQNTGQGAANANDSNFIGYQAGYYATYASNSNFLGNNAGNGATYASNSNFFGEKAGYQATSASQSNFFGFNAGFGTYANNSNFFGYQAGQNASYASQSNFFGFNVGYGATNANNSNFFGNNAGYGATYANDSNFFGYQAGSGAISASYSNFLGNSAGNGATNAVYSNFLGFGAGQNSTDGGNSNFLGYLAGQNASYASYSNFLGNNAGYAAGYSTNSNFIGQSAGYNATYSVNSNFLGQNAGHSSYSTGSNFFGLDAGRSVFSSYSNFLGVSAGQNAASAGYSNFFGYQAGSGATNASYSNLFGYNVGRIFAGNSIGTNNIILGTNISLPNNTVNSLNLGGILFGTGAYSATTGNPSITPQTNGRIGIGVVTPQERLHVSGNTRVDGGLSATTISATTYNNLPTGTTVGSFGITIDGAGSVITTGVKGYTVLPYNAIITGWDVVADTSGSCVIDVWRGSSGTIPTVANTIAGTEKPTLAAQQINSDNNLTSWTTNLSLGDVIAFKVDSVSTVSRVNLIIKVIKI